MYIHESCIWYMKLTPPYTLYLTLHFYLIIIVVYPYIIYTESLLYVITLYSGLDHLTPVVVRDEFQVLKRSFCMKGYHLKLASQTIYNIDYVIKYCAPDYMAIWVCEVTVKDSFTHTSRWQLHTNIISCDQYTMCTICHILMAVYFIWLVGLGVWFSLWVREVPGSNPGRALFK